MREDSGRLINIYAYLELLYACRIHFGAKRMKRLYTYRNLCEFKNRFIVYFGKYHLCQFARSDTSYAASVRGYAIRRRISMPKCTPFVAHARRTVRRQLNKFFYSLLFTATVDAGRLHLYGIINLIIIEKNPWQNIKLRTAKEEKMKNQFSAWHILFSLVPSLAHSLLFSSS